MTQLPLPTRPVIATAAWIGVFCALAVETTASTPPKATEQAALLADAVDGRLDRFSLFEAALLAGADHDRQALDRYERRLEEIAREYKTCRPTGEPLSSSELRAAEARGLLRFLHQRVFTEYDAACSDVARTLDGGAYNCVSSTVLFLVLSRRAGLDAAPVALPGHVRCRLPGGEPIEVETTCADWFDVVARYPDPADRSALVSRVSGHPAGPQRVLTDVQLLGKIYYNRGVALLERRAYHRALAASRLGWQLDSADSAARENLLSAMNNAALQSADAGQFDRAAELLLECYRLAPDLAPLAANDLHVHQRFISHLCETGRFAEALDVLASGRRRRPDAALFDDGRHAVYRAWIGYLDGKGDADRLRAVTTAAEDCRLQDAPATESQPDI